MIPAIAVMIGFYILVRLVELARDEIMAQRGSTPSAVGVMAVLGWS